MKIFRIVILIVLVVLGAASGLAKIMLIPEEAEFFKRVGFSETLLVIFGIIQLISSIILLLEKTRILGAYILTATLLLSSIFIFVSGKIVFGFISILPVILTIFIIVKNKTHKT